MSTYEDGRRFAEVQIRIGNHYAMIEDQARLDRANASTQAANNFLDGVIARCKEEEQDRLWEMEVYTR